MSAVIESPCIAVCLMNPEDKQCRGCYRNLDEIARWRRFSPAERRAIMEQLPARKAAADAKLEN